MILQPMKPAKLDLAKTGHRRKLEEFFESPNYIAEEKIDGCHYFADAGRFLSTQISKKTNDLVDKTGNFPHLVEIILKSDLGQTILDGEIHYPGTSSYEATQITGCSEDEAIRRQEKELGWINYIIFDVLRDAKGNWLFNEPWYKRREYLEQIGLKLQGLEHISIIPVKRSRKRQFMDKQLEEGKEGIVLKNVNGLYIPGKRPMDNWMKIKKSDTDDVIITGFDDPNKRYTGTDYDTWPYWEEGEPVSKHYYLKQIGSVRFGLINPKTNQIIELGSCTGIDDYQRQLFTENQDEYIGKVMEIKFMEKTKDGRYRHPNFVRVHSDKNPHECIFEGVV